MSTSSPYMSKNKKIFKQEDIWARRFGQQDIRARRYSGKNKRYTIFYNERYSGKNISRARDNLLARRYSGKKIRARIKDIQFFTTRES